MEANEKKETQIIIEENEQSSLEKLKNTANMYRKVNLKKIV